MAAKSRSRAGEGAKRGGGLRVGGRRGMVHYEDSDGGLEDWLSADNHDSHNENEAYQPAVDEVRASVSRELQDAQQDEGWEEVQMDQPRRSRRIGTRKGQLKWREWKEQDLI